MKKTWLAFIVVVLSCFLFMGMAGAQGLEPSPEELAAYNQEIQGIEASVQHIVRQSTQRFNPMGGELIVRQGTFQGSHKSSILSNAVKRARQELEGKVNAFMNSLAQEGLVPVDDPPMEQNLDHKWGVTGFPPKFYVRLTLTLKVYCQKVPQ